jgi:hypothetical protein
LFKVLSLTFKLLKDDFKLLKGQLSGSDVDLFAKSAFQKSRNIGRLDFTPTFDDELPYDPVIAISVPL